MSAERPTKNDEVSSEPQKIKKGRPIPPPPTKPPPGKPPPTRPSRDTSPLRIEQQKEDDGEDNLEMEDIMLEEQYPENGEEEDEGGEGGEEYSYARGRIRGSTRVREASPSPERGGEDDDEDEGSHTDPDYANIFPDVTNQATDSDYMNIYEEKERRKRPLSNYLNVAPLPEPLQQGTKTSGQPTSNAETERTPHPRYGKLHRAPARPPPGFKKMPSPNVSPKKQDNEDKSEGGEDKVQLRPQPPPVRKKAVKRVSSDSIPPKPQRVSLVDAAKPVKTPSNEFADLSKPVKPVAPAKPPHADPTPVKPVAPARTPHADPPTDPKPVKPVRLSVGESESKPVAPVKPPRARHSTPSSPSQPPLSKLEATPIHKEATPSILEPPQVKERAMTETTPSDPPTSGSHLGDHKLLSRQKSASAADVASAPPTTNEPRPQSGDHSPSVVPSKKAPPPPHTRQKSTDSTHSGTPPTSKKELISPSTGRKVAPARTAPPPPKPGPLPPRTYMTSGSSPVLDAKKPSDVSGSSSSPSSSSLNLSQGEGQSISGRPPPPVPPKAIITQASMIEGEKEEKETTALTKDNESSSTNKEAATITSTSSLSNTNESSVVGGNEDKKSVNEGALARMDLFSVELNRVEGEGFGLHIAEGYAQTRKGLEVGVFVKEIVPNSAAYRNGHVCESDMLVEIAGVSMVGATLEDAARVLRNAGKSVRLKVGRTLSNASHSKENNESFKEEMASVKKELKESQETVSDLTQALANVTVEKTKLELKVKSLTEKLNSSADKDNESTELKAKLKEATEKQEKASDEIQSLNEKVNSLESDLEKERKESERLREELASVKADLEKEREENSSRIDAEEQIAKVREELVKERKAKELATKGLSEKIIELEEKLESASQEANDSSSPDTDKMIETQKELEATKEQLSSTKSILATTEERLRETEEKLTTNVASLQETKEKLRASEEALMTTNEKLVIAEKKSSEKKEDKDKEEGEKEEKEEEGKEDKEDTVKEETQPETEDKPEELAITAEPQENKEKEEEKKEEKKEEEIEEVKQVEKPVPRERKASGSSTTSSKGTKSRETTPEGEPKPFGTLKLASTGQLDCSASRDRARLSSQRRRKKPSLDHVRSLGNISMIFPEEMPRLTIQEEEEESKRDAATPVKLPQLPPPKVKPRAQPRKKVASPEPTETKPEEPPTASPKPAKRPIPVPRLASKDKTADAAVDQTDEKTTPSKTSTSPEAQAPTASPKPAKKPIRSSLHEEDSAPTTSSPTPPMKKPKPVPPKPSPRTSTPVQEDDPLEGLKRKDPAELTVKEKMILAQQAMAKQAEYKSKGIPPPIRKKKVPLPKSSSIDVSDSPTRQKRESKADEDNKKAEEDEVDGMERSKSMEDLVEDTAPKRQPRKLPPGAFNIGIPMGLPGDMRHRSYTVASGTSSDGNEQSQNEETQPEKEEDKNETEIPRSDTQVSDKSQPSPQPSPQTTPKTTPKKSPKTTPIHAEAVDSSPEVSKKIPMSSSADNLELSEDELDGPSPDIDQEEMLRGASSQVTSSAQPDIENILFWSPEVVGMWLGNIGLGGHAGAFKEKGIKGYMLFDLDGAKLKSFGMSSNDDRNAFKKELKVLKPYADKLKKEYEKKQKEEKKRQKEEAKKKKK